MKKIPFDFKASLDIPDWHKDFVAVVNEQVMDTFLKEQSGRIVQYIQTLDNDKKRDNFLLSLPSLISKVNGLVFSLYAVDSSQKKGVDLVSTLGEVNFLKTGDKKYLKNRQKRLLIEKLLKTYFFRRIVRTFTWTKWWKLPLTIFKPDIIAIGHNEILRQKAIATKQSIYFYQSSLLLNKINKYNTAKYQQADYLEVLSKEIYTILVGHLNVKNKYIENFQYIVNNSILEILLRDDKALQNCNKYPKLPKNIWIGTGTAYSFRLLALVVLRNGGQVTSFAHATSNVLLPSYEMLYRGEFAVTNNFVEITPKVKEFYYQNYLKQFPISINKSFKVSSIKQNNKFKKYQKRVKNNNKRPTVIYTSNAMIDMVNGAPFSHYMAYLEWQLRLTNMLDKMDINLICQPHPEGIFIDKSLTHPLREKYKLPYRSFETIMQEADVFLVDFIHSTTMGEMLVTDKPIVRISWLDEPSYYGVRKELQPLLDKRCRNIKANFDKNGLLTINEKELEKALTHNWQEKVDSTEFRELLIGEK